MQNTHMRPFVGPHGPHPLAAAFTGHRIAAPVYGSYAAGVMRNPVANAASNMIRPHAPTPFTAINASALFMPALHMQTNSMPAASGATTLALSLDATLELLRQLTSTVWGHRFNEPMLLEVQRHVPPS
eukprot:GDKI01039878.1.p1 GENE.GDKI01039878.1~~GDKI01039878.1.p1  ORF type:complete len:128 (-),score=6.91 GDKI01039878.1:30-413(-)